MHTMPFEELVFLLRLGLGSNEVVSTFIISGARLSKNKSAPLRKVNCPQSNFRSCLIFRRQTLFRRKSGRLRTGVHS